MLGKWNILCAIKANNKNITDKIRGQIRKLSGCIYGYRENIKDTKSKDLGEDFSVGVWLLDSSNMLFFLWFIYLITVYEYNFITTIIKNTQLVFFMAENSIKIVLPKDPVHLVIKRVIFLNLLISFSPNYFFLP